MKAASFTPRDAVEKFRALHESGCFVLPNPWDKGTAIYLHRLGFKALATTSAAHVFETTDAGCVAEWFGVVLFSFDILFASNPRHDCAASPRSGGRIFQCSTRESGLHLFRGRKQKWCAGINRTKAV